MDKYYDDDEDNEAFESDLSFLLPDQARRAVERKGEWDGASTLVNRSNPPSSPQWYHRKGPVLLALFLLVAAAFWFYWKYYRVPDHDASTENDQKKKTKKSKKEESRATEALSDEKEQTSRVKVGDEKQPQQQQRQQQQQTRQGGDKTDESQHVGFVFPVPNTATTADAASSKIYGMDKSMNVVSAAASLPLARSTRGLHAFKVLEPPTTPVPVLATPPSISASNPEPTIHPEKKGVSEEEKHEKPSIETVENSTGGDKIIPPRPIPDSDSISLSTPGSVSMMRGSTRSSPALQSIGRGPSSTSVPMTPPIRSSHLQPDSLPPPPSQPPRYASSYIYPPSSGAPVSRPSTPSLGSSSGYAYPPHHHPHHQSPMISHEMKHMYTGSMMPAVEDPSYATRSHMYPGGEGTYSRSRGMGGSSDQGDMSIERLGKEVPTMVHVIREPRREDEDEETYTQRVRSHAECIILLFEQQRSHMDRLQLFAVELNERVIRLTNENKQLLTRLHHLDKPRSSRRTSPLRRDTEESPPPALSQPSGPKVKGNHTREIPLKRSPSSSAAATQRTTRDDRKDTGERVAGHSLYDHESIGTRHTTRHSFLSHPGVSIYSDDSGEEDQGEPLSHHPTPTESSHDEKRSRASDPEKATASPSVEKPPKDDHRKQAAPDKKKPLHGHREERRDTEEKEWTPETETKVARVDSRPAGKHPTDQPEEEEDEEEEKGGREESKEKDPRYSHYEHEDEGDHSERTESRVGDSRKRFTEPVREEEKHSLVAKTRTDANVAAPLETSNPDT